MARFTGQRLREARNAAGISRERLALDVGRSYHSLELYESGRAAPPLPILYRLADALGVGPADLLDADAPEGSEAA